MRVSNKVFYRSTELIRHRRRGRKRNSEKITEQPELFIPSTFRHRKPRSVLIFRLWANILSVQMRHRSTRLYAQVILTLLPRGYIHISRMYTKYFGITVAAREFITLQPTKKEIFEAPVNHWTKFKRNELINTLSARRLIDPWWARLHDWSYFLGPFLWLDENRFHVEPKILYEFCYRSIHDNILELIRICRKKKE